MKKIQNRGWNLTMHASAGVHDFFAFANYVITKGCSGITNIGRLFSDP